VGLSEKGIFLYIYSYMKIIITESKLDKLSKSLLNQIEEYGWMETADLVGGPENLLSILGKSKENVINLLLSNFKDLSVRKGGGGVLSLYDKGLTLMQTSSWTSNTIAFDSNLRFRMGDNLLELYLEYRRDLIRELISRFPELYSEVIDVYEDSGLYKKLDTFEL
jgi:hypothetical protein